MHAWRRTTHTRGTLLHAPRLPTTTLLAGAPGSDGQSRMLAIGPLPEVLVQEPTGGAITITHFPDFEVPPTDAEYWHQERWHDVLIEVELIARLWRRLMEPKRPRGRSAPS
jgi:hypothetical protein